MNMHKIRQVILIFFNSEEDGLFMFGRGGKGEVLWNHQGQVYSIHMNINVKVASLHPLGAVGG